MRRNKIYYFIESCKNQVILNIQFLSLLLLHFSPLSQKEFGENTFASFCAWYEMAEMLWSERHLSCPGLRYLARLAVSQNQTQKDYTNRKLRETRSVSWKAYSCSKMKLQVNKIPTIKIVGVFTVSLLLNSCHFPLKNISIF